ncbi:hypothetical protein ACFQDE_05985 [Deinococcus caeni]|uniref:Uncharacterized protein n=1 Tax=Deinococcus caeni TaxID=569127 RepID=A0ABP9U7H7_9DEIO
MGAVPGTHRHAPERPAEVLGGLGLLHPATRPAARWGLLALLLAVFPANVAMAQSPERFGLPGWALWARLPLQPLLMWAVWRACGRGCRCNRC